MLSYLNHFLTEFEYPKEDVETLQSAYLLIDGESVSRETLLGLFGTYRENINCDYTDIVTKCDDIAVRIGLDPYTVYLLTFICLSKQLKENYRLRGIDEDIWKNGMYDLKYKLLECKKAKGICGIFVPAWYKGFFNMTRFALGRLQFEIKPFGHTYEKNGKSLTEDSPVINIHIPQTGTSFDKGSRLDAYQKARAFFADEFADKPMAFFCHSWMLYEGNRDILKEGSNILSFMDDFDIFKTETVAKGRCPFAWLIFGTEYAGDPDALPESSSLQRAYKDRLKNGGDLGRGYGVFFA